MKSASLMAALALCASAVVFCPAGGASPFGQGGTGQPQITPCDVGAYVVDQDPQGLNVRSGPGRAFEVTGNLPRTEDTGIGVHITGSSGEWVRIDLAVEEGGEEDRTFFRGEGWVYAPLLGLSGMAIDRGGTPLYQGPTTRSRVVTRVPGGDGVTLRGCRGPWVYVEYKKLRGWAAPHTLCDNPLTTCA